jgi:hypothetical protein
MVGTRYRLPIGPIGIGRSHLRTVSVLEFMFLFVSLRFDRDDIQGEILDYPSLNLPNLLRLGLDLTAIIPENYPGCYQVIASNFILKKTNSRP